MILKRVPKETYVGESMGIEIANATISFNDGMTCLEGVSKRQNVNPGKYTLQSLAKLDSKCIACAERNISLLLNKVEKRYGAWKMGIRTNMHMKKGWCMKRVRKMSYKTIIYGIYLISM